MFNNIKGIEMITPISFSGTYKLYGNAKNASSCLELADNLYMDNCKTRIDFPSANSLDKHKSELSLTTVVPDNYNGAVEQFCKRNGIPYKKMDTDVLMKEKEINSRILVTEGNKKTPIVAKINSEKLDKLLETQKIGNIKHNESDYEEYFKDDVNFLIKNGEPIRTTTFLITSNMAGNTNDVLEYLDRFGDNLNEDSLFLDFISQTDEPDQCVYFGLKDAGMKEIPVYMDKDTYLISKKLGLLSK